METESHDSLGGTINEPKEIYLLPPYSLRWQGIGVRDMYTLLGWCPSEEPKFICSYVDLFCKCYNLARRCRILQNFK